MSVKAKVSMFRDMLYFKEVVTAKQISAAAAKNGIKPSNLSKIIQNMEKIATKKFFLRTARGLEPTCEALKIAEMISGAEKHFDSLSQKFTKKNVPGILNLYLPSNLKIKDLSNFCRQYPGLTLILCKTPLEADVWVDYEGPTETNDWVCVRNHIGAKFKQTIWVCSVQEKTAIALAQFIISEMHHQ